MRGGTTEERTSAARNRALGGGLLVALVLSSLSYTSTAQSAASVWGGVYTEEQAQRGRRVYARECTECHGEQLRGGETAPGLIGKEFVDFWSDTTVGELFELTRETMPEENPGELGDGTYADLVAYVLEANKFPAGDAELSSDVDQLSRIDISPEP